jgi:hypothetical protein
MENNLPGENIFLAVIDLSLAPMVMMVLLAAGKIEEGLMGIYLLGLFWLLILAFIQFLMFLYFVGFAQENSDTIIQ